MSEKPPRVLVTGGTGYVGQLIARHLAGRGFRVRLASRQRPPEGWFSFPFEWAPLELDPQADFATALADVDHVVHAAFQHVAGRYRGGEGDDVEGFYRANRDASLRFLTAAKTAGVKRAIFLSSRAVYGSLEGPLDETMVPEPDTHYGHVKFAVEAGLCKLCLAPPEAFAPLAVPSVTPATPTMGFAGASLRVTGVYGLVEPLERTKWMSIARQILDGTLEIAPRVATEVHGEDVGQAVALLLEAPAEMAAGQVYNCSDLLLSNREIVAALRKVLVRPGSLPERGDERSVAIMRCNRLRRLGWQPGGRARFAGTIDALAGVCGAEANEPTPFP
ncbi:nucleoside-diphosphate-sugar epimerase [Rhodopseudomonas julia]|uniref:Nucleoside-diphosphate-sugar epimerase n=1 Tax=Rhodopseudomonas julia TaxID=200617 RepID=A0ABU0C0Y9_9BRAD|nr:NAD(P)-dependent oxidoreductase [Rhodopseudomonas julia]MDQ0324192.1 nucleoside-diphosphate-sugar epimerase [Rhodopseudomonas julia]